MLVFLWIIGCNLKKTLFYMTKLIILTIKIFLFSLLYVLSLGFVLLFYGHVSQISKGAAGFVAIVLWYFVHEFLIIIFFKR